jgi:phosphate transport system ATP-binding protein
MLFQQANPFPMSIRKNIDLPLRDWGVTDKQQRRHKIEEALTKVGLWSEVCHRLEDSALQLSGGQKQRLCLARTIALDPEVLLMDEPCSALDPMASARIEQLIHKLKEEITIIIVTHNLAQAKRVADQVHLFWFDDEKKGHIIESAEREAFFRTPQQALTRSYLEGAIG